MSVRETIIEPAESTDVTPETAPKKRGGRKKKTADIISYEEAQQKLARVFNGVCALLKIEKRYKEKDFAEEAKDLSRMAGKYDVVNTVLTVLDPLFLVLGLIGKATDIVAENKERKAKIKNEQAQQEEQVQQQQPGQITLAR